MYNWSCVMSSIFSWLCGFLSMPRKFKGVKVLLFRKIFAVFLKIRKRQHGHVHEFNSGELVFHFLNATKTFSYGPKIMKNIEIKYVFSFWSMFSSSLTNFIQVATVPLIIVSLYSCMLHFNPAVEMLSIRSLTLEKILKL